MPTSHHPRRTPCLNCGDTVLIAERTAGKMMGARFGKGPQIWLEHADPGPDGELFDPVDEECTRPRVG